MSSGYHFSTKELVTMAVLSALGGILSTYIGYLGNLLNKIIGVPFGAGQFMAGLHIFWIILAYGLTKKKGTALTTGFLKGFVEFLSGGKLGLFAVVLTVMQAAIVEAVFLLFPDRKTKTFAVAGGFSTVANIFFFQLIFAPYNAFPLFLALSLVAFISGILFAGIFSKSVVDLLSGKDTATTGKNNLKKAATFGVIFSLVFGAAYFYTTKPNGEIISVTGEVEHEISFSIDDYENKMITINAEMIGQYKYEPPTDYKGVPLQVVLADASPTGTKVTIIATDAYEVTFLLEDVLSTEDIILVQDDKGIRLVAKNYDGNMWVRNVIKIKVE
ncbi:MAG: ECF transporter S component [Candidatus Methanofastidiosia archaeon]